MIKNPSRRAVRRARCAWSGHPRPISEICDHGHHVEINRDCRCGKKWSCRVIDKPAELPAPRPGMLRSVS